MSSVDSSLLSGASYITHNIYSGIFNGFKTSKKENVIVFRISVLILGISSTLLSLFTSSIYGLWVLAGDLGYVIVFPQFVASVFLAKHVTFSGNGILLQGRRGRIDFYVQVTRPIWHPE